MPVANPRSFEPQQITVIDGAKFNMYNSLKSLNYQSCMCGLWQWYSAKCNHLHTEAELYCGHTSKWSNPKGVKYCSGRKKEVVVSSIRVDEFCVNCQHSFALNNGNQSFSGL